MKETSNLLESALWYRERGYSVVPVKPDKTPYVKWEPYQRQRADAEQIRQWWKKWPDAMVGIVTGEISNIMVVDVDSEQGLDALNQFLPDTIQTPTATTPGGGFHYWFRYKSGLVNRARVITDCDVRTDGGYVIVAPSRNGTGKKYEWVLGLKISDIEPAEMPEFLFDILSTGRGTSERSSASIYNKNTSFIERQHSDNIGDDNNRQHATTSDNIGFAKGQRDETLFHLAHHLVKSRMPTENIRKYLEYFGVHCNPPFPQKEIHEKVQSALKRFEKVEIGLTQEIRELVLTTSGNISTTFCQQVTTSDNISNRNHNKKVNEILRRLSKEGLLEQTGTAGIYRRVESDCEPEDWLSAETESVDLKLPFELSDIAEIMPGSVILIAGEPNSGKTGFLMNVAHDNMRNWKTHYFSSEMGKAMFKRRAKKFPYSDLSGWDVQFYQRAGNFGDAIKPGQGNLNIIDYIELHDNFYHITKYLADIYTKLDGGIAVVAIQKGPGQDLGRGGSFTLEKPVLAVSLFHSRAKIVKLKEWKESVSENPNGKEYRFKLIDGCRFKRESGWHHPSKVN